MTVNLLHKVHDKLDDRLTGQIGGLLGENEERTRAGIAAAVPTLLRGILGVATIDQGVQMVERELDSLDDVTVDDFAKQLAYDNSRALIEHGWDLVQAFWGNATIRAMSVISRESGLSATKCRFLAGLLMPLVLGVLGKHRQENHLDTAAFQRLLASQCDFLAGKVPAGVCAALNLPKLEKKPFYPPPGFRPTLTPDRPAVTSPTSLELAASTKLAPETASATTSTTAIPTCSSPYESTNTLPAYSEGGLEWLWGVIVPLVLLVALLGWLFTRDRATPRTDSTRQASQVDAQPEHVAASLDWDDPAPTRLDQTEVRSMLDQEIPTLAPSFDDDEEGEEDVDEDSANDAKTVPAIAEPESPVDQKASLSDPSGS